MRSKGKFFAGVSRLARKLAGDETGSPAVEFALVFPIFIAARHAPGGIDLPRQGVLRIGGGRGGEGRSDQSDRDPDGGAVPDRGLQPADSALQLRAGDRRARTAADRDDQPQLHAAAVQLQRDRREHAAGRRRRQRRRLGDRHAAGGHVSVAGLRGAARPQLRQHGQWQDADDVAPGVPDRAAVMIRHLGLLRRSGRAFLADAGGLAAIELALILPFAAMLMSLVVYGGQAYWVQRKVTLAATTVANIFAQANNTNASTISAAELNQILAYPNLILYPYNATGVAVEVSQLQVTVNANGTATGTVCGSWANANGTPRPTNQQLSVDPSIAAAFSGTANNDSPNCNSPANYVVLGEVQYPFQPTGLYFAVSTMTLHDSIIMIPRVASPIPVQ